MKSIRYIISSALSGIGLQTVQSGCLCNYKTDRFQKVRYAVLSNL